MVLARIGSDGTFLAVNQAGLSMFDAATLGQVLGTPLHDRLGPDERSTSVAFLKRVVAGHRGSIEVELLGPNGLSHTLELHAAPHPGAPDGIASALVTFRDVTEARRLELSLVEAMARQTEQEAAHENERARLLAELESVRASAEGRAPEEDEQVGALERRLAEAEGRHAEVTERQTAEIAGLTEALDDQGRIVAEQAARLAQLATLEAEQARLRQENEALSRQSGADTEALRTALEEARAEQTRLAEALAEREQQLAAADAAREGRETRISELEAALQAAEQSRNQSDGSEEQLQLAREQHRAREAELERQLADHTQAHQAQLAELQQQAAAADLTNQQRLQEIESLLEESRGLLAAAEQAQGTRIAELEAALEEARRAGEETAAELRAAAGEASVAHQGRVAQLEAAVSEAHEAAQARVSELEATLAEAERARGAAAAELDAALAGAREADTRVSGVEARLAEAERARESLAADFEERVGSLQAEVETLAAAYKKADAALLEDREAFEAQLAAAALARQNLEQTLAAALAGRDAAYAQLRRLGEAAEALAREAAALAREGDSSPAAATAGQISTNLEPRLTAAFGSAIQVTVLVASPASPVAVPIEAFEGAVLELAADRASTMKSGQATIEVADVEIDEGVAAVRQMAPGPYVLWAMHLSGKGADRHLAAELFETADAAAWQEISPELQSAIEAMAAAGTHTWLAREDGRGVVFEFYLPRRRAATPEVG